MEIKTKEKLTFFAVSATEMPLISTCGSSRSSMIVGTTARSEEGKSGWATGIWWVRVGWVVSPSVELILFLLKKPIFPASRKGGMMS